MCTGPIMNWLASILLVISFVQVILCDIKLNEHDFKIGLNENASANIIVSNLPESKAILTLISQHEDIVRTDPNVITLDNKNYTIPITIEALGAGHSEVYSNISVPSISVEDIFLRVTVYKNAGLDIFSTVIGWIYFLAWSVSFYPQIYINYKRKSVIGLNFDFLGLNIVGFTLYSIFNLGLYFIPEIKAEYAARNPRGLNPVLENDIVFAVHAVFACVVTITQCRLYERGEQRVSTTAKTILGIFASFLFISMILVGASVIHWLDFLYYCSYVKLTITLIKYVPQAYMNYKRKSTVGWSIGNIFLDFTGGMLSMLQMIINAYNYDDWASIFGDPTKFGLGLFSVVFDIFFILQHYVLYRHNHYLES